MLRLVFQSTLTPTQGYSGRQKLRGEAMDWKHLLAYMTGSVDQALRLRNEYLVTENRTFRCSRQTDRSAYRCSRTEHARFRALRSSVFWCLSRMPGGK